MSAAKNGYRNKIAIKQFYFGFYSFSRHDDLLLPSAGFALMQTYKTEGIQVEVSVADSGRK